MPISKRHFFRDKRFGFILALLLDPSRRAVLPFPPPSAVLSSDGLLSRTPPRAASISFNQQTRLGKPRRLLRLTEKIKSPFPRPEALLFRSHAYGFSGALRTAAPRPPRRRRRLAEGTKNKRTLPPNFLGADFGETQKLYGQTR